MRVWIAMHAARGAQRIVELAEHHREHVAERALEPTDHIRARLRVMIDRVRDHRMRELQQRGAAAAEEHREIATDLPRDRCRTEDPGARIAHASRKLGERGLELLRGDDRHPSVGCSPASGAVRCAPQRAGRATQARRKSARATVLFGAAHAAALRDPVMQTMVSHGGRQAQPGSSTEPGRAGCTRSPGAKAGPWIVERELGRGGMGTVYAVVHEEIGKRAALKVMHRRLLDARHQRRAHAARGAGRQPGRPPEHRRHLRDRHAARRPARTS